MAERSRVHRNTISDIERGTRNPRPATVDRLARALAAEPRDLIGATIRRQSSTNGVLYATEAVRLRAASLLEQGLERLPQHLAEHELADLKYVCKLVSLLLQKNTEEEAIVGAREYAYPPETHSPSD